MDTDTVLNTALFSGIIGFVAFCASYAAHVWRSRNRTSLNAKARGARLVGWGFLSLMLGCFLVLASLIWQQVKPREGVLSGEGLYTVRADDQLTVEFVTPARTVAAGELVARFVSPERRAEMIGLELKRQILETQKKVVALQPAALDSELVRHYEKCVADQRQLLSSLTYLVPEHAVVVREKLRDRLDKTERINALTTRLENSRRELQQAVARRSLAEKHSSRLENLAQTGAAADVERDERSTERVVLDAEVSRLEASIANIELERKHLQESLPLFAACTSQQAEELERELGSVREQLESVKQDVHTSRERLHGDRKRAELLKAEMLAQLELEIEQCRAQLDGIQDVLAIKAPFDGIVAYADPAPANALPKSPVAILAPEKGFRFRLRMSEAEVKALSRSDSVTLGLVAPILHRRFPGRLIEWEKLPHEPGFVVAELACMPPPETIRDLAAHDWGAHEWAKNPAFKVRLLWQAPVYACPLFYPAIGMLAVGAVALLAGWLSKSRSDADRASKNDASPAAVSGANTSIPAELARPLTAASPAVGRAEMEAGALGRSLQMLGQRMRESIKRQAVEPSLLNAVEWALDRHQARAIEHLAAGMDHDPEFTEIIRKLAVRPDRDTRLDRAATVPDQRVLRILQAVVPELLTGADKPANSQATSEVGPRLRQIGALR